MKWICSNPQLSRTGDACFGAYSTMDGAGRKAAVKAHFMVEINPLEPLVRGLKQALSGLQREASSQSSETLHQGELLPAIEGMQSLADDLTKILRSGSFATTRSTPRAQLDHIMLKPV